MLTVICGEDTVASREYYYSTLEAWRKKGAAVTPVTADDLAGLPDRQAAGLFTTETVYTIENLNRHFGGRRARHGTDVLDRIAASPHTHLIDWENGVSARELKIGTSATVREHKPSENIFKLLDACLPGNAGPFLSILHNITDVKNEMFVYLMLTRHIRSVLLTKQSDRPQSPNPWQQRKLASAARTWDGAKLADFYSRLLAIDTSLKTGRNVYGVQKSLDILACYYL